MEIVCKKVKFANEKEATFALEKVAKLSTRKNIPIRCYKCKCGGWHLTSRPDSFELQKQVEKLKIENAELYLDNEKFKLQSKVTYQQIQQELEKKYKPENRKILLEAKKLELIKQQQITIQNQGSELKKLYQFRDELLGKLHAKNK